MDNHHRSHSRLKTPWDDFKERTPSQEFIRTVYIEHYNSRHLNLQDSNESKLLNSYQPSRCPYCSSSEFRLFGKTRNGIQRYQCENPDCRRTFTVTTGTIFEDHKICVNEWIEYCINLFHYASLSIDSQNNKNAITTSEYWLQKLFLILEKYPSTITLQGRITMDETYYSVRRPDIQLKPDGTKPRGFSRNKICIATACDDQHIFCCVCGNGKPSLHRITHAFKEVIVPCSTLVHDGDNSHDELIHELNLISEVHTTEETHGLQDEDNPLGPINHVHFLLKNFLHSHSSFDRDDLQGYLNLFCFIMNPPFRDLEKVDVLLNLAISVYKTLRYRTNFAKK